MSEVWLESDSDNTHSNSIAEYLLSSVESILKDVIPRRQLIDVAGGPSRSIALDDVRLYHAVAVHGYEGISQSPTVAQKPTDVQTCIEAMMKSRIPMPNMTYIMVRRCLTQ